MFYFVIIMDFLQFNCVILIMKAQFLSRNSWKQIGTFRMKSVRLKEAWVPISRLLYRASGHLSHTVIGIGWVPISRHCQFNRQWGINKRSECSFEGLAFLFYCLFLSQLTRNKYHNYLTIKKNSCWMPNEK